MKKIIAIYVCILLLSSLCACNLQSAATPVGPDSNTVATGVALTLAALTQSASQQTPLASPTLAQPTNTQLVALSSPTFRLIAALTATILVTPTPTTTLAPTSTPVPKPGTITGSISGYPYGTLGSLAIVAFGQQAPYNYSYWITASGDTSYTMTSSYLIPGQYQVVAYDSSGHIGGCPGLVAVVSQQTVTCDITDWGGGYPSKPFGVPNP
ncbi:MAG: hypothetical protein WCE68_01260 [Anaerolineales bacterium]